MTKSAAILAAGAALLASCAQQPGTPVRAAGQSSGQQCFRAQQASGYTPVSDNVVLVQAGASRYFRLELAGACPNIDWSRRLALRTMGGGSWICRGADAEIIVPDPQFAQRCLVTDVRQITKDEWQAARRAR